MYIILLMLAVKIFLMCSLSHPLSDLFSLSCNRDVLWQCLVAPVALLLLLGDLSLFKHIYPGYLDLSG